MIINHYSIICDSTIQNGTQTVIRISFSKNSFNYPHSAVIELKLSSYISYSNSCYLTNPSMGPDKCYAFSKMINGVMYLYFDVTHMIQYHYYEGDLLFTFHNPSNSFNISVGDSKMIVKYLTPSDSYLKQQLKKYQVGNSIVYSFDILSFSGNVVKNLYPRLFDYSLSLVFGEADSLSTYFSFFPKGWKLNLFQHLIKNTSDSYTLVDENFISHRFKPIINQNSNSKSNSQPRTIDDIDYYINEDGDGRILQVLKENNSIISYQVISPVGDAYVEFGSNKTMSKIHLENGKEVTFSYTSTSITITDYNNNVLTISKTSSDKIIISHNHSDQTYELTLDSANNLVAITYVSPTDDETYLTDTFEYSNDQLSEVNESSGYSLAIDYPYPYTKNIILSRNNTVLNDDYFEHESRYIKYTNNISTVAKNYYFDDEYNLQTCLETDRGVTGSEFLHYVSNTLRTLLPCIAKSSPKHIKLTTDDINHYDSVSVELHHDPTYNNNPFVVVHTENLDDVLDDSKQYLLVFKVKQNKLIPSTLDLGKGLHVICGKLSPINVCDYSVSSDGLRLLTIDSFGEGIYTLPVNFTQAGFTFPGAEESGITFAIRNNDGVFTFSDFLAFELEECNHDTFQFLRQNSISYSPLFFPGTYLNDYKLSIEDIKTNELVLMKYGYTKFFFTDKLTNLFVYGENDANKLIDILDLTNLMSPAYFTDTFFETLTFKFISKKDNKTLSSVYVNNNDGSYTVNTQIEVGNNTYDTSQTYDFHGNLLSETDYHGITKNCTYDANQQITGKLTISAPLTRDLYPHLYISESYDYDNLGRLVEITSPVGNQNAITEYVYFSNINVISEVSDGESNTTSYLYTLNYEQLVKTILGVGGNTDYTCINVDDNLRPSSFSDVNNSFVFTYDSKNELSSIDWEGHNEQTRDKIPIDPDFPIFIMPLLDIAHAYNNDGSYSVTYHPKLGAFYKKEYDKYGRITRYYCLTSSSGLDINYQYNSQYEDGLLSTITDYSGYQTETTSLMYNSKRLLWQLFRNGFVNEQYTYTYSSDNHLSSKLHKVTSNDYSSFEGMRLETGYIYNSFGDELMSVSNSILEQNTMLHIYLPTAIVTSSKTVDELNRTDSLLTHIGSVSIGFTSISYFEFGDNNDYTSYQIKSTTNQSNTVQNYSYDKNGNITAITGGGSLPVIINTYQYDEKQQLISEFDYTNAETEYAYDRNGNILEAKKTRTIKIPHVGIQTEVLYDDIYTYSSTYPNRLETFNGVTITYDNFNNPLTLNGATLTYYRANKLRTYTKNNVTTTFGYNGRGIRVYKQTGNEIHHYLLNENNISRELIINGSTHHQLIYLYGLTGVIGFKYDAQVYLYEKNIFNDVIALYLVSNSSKTLVAKYSYDSFGKTTVMDSNGTENTSSTFIGNINPFRYRSYYQDNETGFYYCQSRYYVPYLRRWLTMDDLSYLDSKSIYGLNLYAYCNNNPIMFRDEEGRSVAPLFITLLIFGLIGATTNFIAQTASDLINGEGFDWGRSGIAAGAGFVGGLFLIIPTFGGYFSVTISAGLNTFGQMAYSRNAYTVDDYIRNTICSVVLSFLSAFVLKGIIANSSFLSKGEVLLSNFLTNSKSLTIANVLSTTYKLLFFNLLESLFDYPFSKSSERLSDIAGTNAEGISFVTKKGYLW